MLKMGIITGFLSQTKDRFHEYNKLLDLDQKFALMAEIDRHRPTLVVLAGFMRILTPGFVRHYEGRLVNIHPSLLPAFPGLQTHQRAIEAGCRFAGCTVHRVTAELDHGEYLEQAVVPVLPGDTPASLAERVLSQEHLVYPRAIERLLARPVLNP